MAKYTTLKPIRFSNEFAQKIQDYANKNYNGNFTKAVNELAAKALKIGDKK